MILFMQIRDPPPEGELFVYGAYMWGCGFEKSTNTEFQDIPPRQVPVSLPVLHLSASVLRNPVTDQSSQLGPTSMEHKGPLTFHCPCFTSHGQRGYNGAHASDVDTGCEALFTVSLVNSDVAAIAKWATRNFACTLRPF